MTAALGVCTKVSMTTDRRIQDVLDQQTAEHEALERAARQSERDYIIQQMFARADVLGAPHNEHLRAFAMELAADMSSDALVRRYSIYLHFFSAKVFLARETSAKRRTTVMRVPSWMPRTEMEPQTMQEHAAAALGVVDGSMNQPRVSAAGMEQVPPTPPKTISEFRKALDRLTR